MSKNKMEMKDKKIIFKKFGIILTTTLFLSSNGLQIYSKLIKDNPYDGSNITSISNSYRMSKSKDFLDNSGLLESFIEIKKLSRKEQNAYLLYYSIVSNYKLTEEEKKELKNYIYYITDNPYVDYQYIYNKFQNLDLYNVNDFSKDNVIGTYEINRNIIKYKYKEALFHEFCHADSKNKTSSWFEEGLTSLIDDEYNECTNPNSYGFYKTVLRIMCEIIGKEIARDILFKCEYNGNCNILKEKLKELNVDSNLVNELFDELDKYHKLFLDNNYNTIEFNYLNTKIKEILAYIYDETHKNEEYINDYIYSYFLYDDLDLNDIKIYYLNTSKIIRNPIANKSLYYYPKEDKVFEEIEKRRRNSNKLKNNVMITFIINDNYYFILNEEELKMTDIINPDKVILELTKYYDDKTVVEYQKHENGNFVIYKTQEFSTNKNKFNEIINHYKNGNKIRR